MPAILPYALCHLKHDIGDVKQNGAQQADQTIVDKAFPQLARLLMEIKYGIELHRVLDGGSGDDKRGIQTLENIINDELTKGFRQSSYLGAVEVCLNFRAIYEQKANRKRRHGRTDDCVAAARIMAAMDIIHKIQESSKSEWSHKRQRGPSGYDEELYDVFS